MKHVLCIAGAWCSRSTYSNDKKTSTLRFTYSDDKKTSTLRSTYSNDKKTSTLRSTYSDDKKTSILRSTYRMVKIFLLKELKYSCELSI